MSRWRGAADESVRYVAAGTLALAFDFGLYSGLIRLAGVDYLVAAPFGFALGLAIVYVLSIRWVFRHRRMSNAHAEFALFALIGLAGMGLNQAVLWVGVEKLALSYELAKVVSAGVVFGFNFVARKLLLFTRY